MNLSDTIGTEGFNAQSTVSAEGFVLFNSSGTFSGILEPLSEIVTQMELGSDVREASRLHVLRSAVPAKLLAADATSQVRIIELSNGAVWKVATRNDNPADIEVRFTVIKVTGQDQ